MAVLQKGVYYLPTAITAPLLAWAATTTPIELKNTFPNSA